MNSMNSRTSVNTCLEALHAANRHLAAIKDRVEILLLSGCPEYIQSDLITISKAEREISQIARSLTIVLSQTATQRQEENSP